METRDRLKITEALWSSRGFVRGKACHPTGRFCAACCLECGAKVWTLRLFFFLFTATLPWWCCPSDENRYTHTNTDDKQMCAAGHFSFGSRSVQLHPPRLCVCACAYVVESYFTISWLPVLVIALCRLVSFFSRGIVFVSSLSSDLCRGLNFFLDLW